MNSSTAPTIFQQLPDELLLKTLKDIRIADIASSCRELQERVSGLSARVPITLTIVHETLPILQDYRRSFKRDQLCTEISVVAAETQYDLTLNVGIKYLETYLLAQEGAKRALEHASVKHEALKASSLLLFAFCFCSWVVLLPYRLACMQRPGCSIRLVRGAIPSAIDDDVILPTFKKLLTEVHISRILVGDLNDVWARREEAICAFCDAVCTFIEAAIDGTIGSLTIDSLLTDRSGMPMDDPGRIDLTGVLPALPSPWRHTVCIAPADDIQGSVD